MTNNQSTSILLLSEVSVLLTLLSEVSVLLTLLSEVYSTAQWSVCVAHTAQIPWKIDNVNIFFHWLDLYNIGHSAQILWKIDNVNIHFYWIDKHIQQYNYYQ